MTIQAMLDSRGGVAILEVPPPSPVVRAPALKNLEESESARDPPCRIRKVSPR